MKRLILALVALTVPMLAYAVVPEHPEHAVAAAQPAPAKPARANSVKTTAANLFTWVVAAVKAASPAHRCDVELLSAADKKLATDPAAGRKMLEPFFEANSAKLKLSQNLLPNQIALNPANINEICDRDVWSRVHASDAAQTDPMKKFSAISLQEQIPVLLGIDEAFFKLDWQAEVTIAKAKEVLAAGEALGLVTLADVQLLKTTRAGGKLKIDELVDKQSTIVADFDMKNPKTKLPVEKQVGAILLLLNEKQQAKPDPIGPLVGSQVKEYHKSILAFRDVLRAYADARYVNNKPMLAKLTSNLAATGNSPGQAIDMTGSMWSVMGEIAAATDWKDLGLHSKAALSDVDWRMRNRLGVYHRQVHDLVTTLDAKIRAAGGVEEVVTRVKLQVAANKGVQLEAQAKAADQNAASRKGLEASLGRYEAAFKENVTSKHWDGMKERAELNDAQKASLQKDFVEAVAKAPVDKTGDGKNYVLTVPGHRIVTPVPQTAADATVEKAAGAAEKVAKSILASDEFSAKGAAFLGALIPETAAKPIETKLPDAPLVPTTAVASVPAGSPLAKQIADTGCGGPGDLGKSNEARFRNNQMAALGDKWSKYSTGAGKAQTQHDTAARALEQACSEEQARIKQTYKSAEHKDLLDAAMKESTADCATKRKAIEGAYDAALIELGGTKNGMAEMLQEDQKVIDGNLRQHYPQAVEKPLGEVLAKLRTHEGLLSVRARGLKESTDFEGKKVSRPSDKPLYGALAGSTLTQYLDQRWVKDRVKAVEELVQSKDGLNFGPVTGYHPDKKLNKAAKVTPEEPSTKNIERFIIEKDFYDWLSKKPAPGAGEIAGPAAPPAVVPADETPADRAKRIDAAGRARLAEKAKQEAEAAAAKAKATADAAVQQ